MLSSISFNCDWLTAGADISPLRETVAQFTLGVGDSSLTRHEDTWSKTVRDSVLVSVYPLAMWFAASWWRLNHEPLPEPRSLPSAEWRMAHEIGAANHGYVWPHVVLASDGEMVQVWAEPSQPDTKQSVRYLAGLTSPRVVSLASFQAAVDAFIDGVLARLRAVGQPDTDLAGLWSLVLEDRACADQARVRRLEAQLGFDPEECPDSIVEHALELQARIGAAAFSELAPAYARRSDEAGLVEMARLADAEGLHGRPEVAALAAAETGTALFPWQRAVEAARAMRSQLGEISAPVDDAVLYGLLGLDAKTVAEWTPEKGRPVSVAVPEGKGELRFMPRKRHPIGKRFEFARFLADHLNVEKTVGQWLTSTDLATARQKFQRAFAAEFLCPITSVVSFLGHDFSESAIEEAALHYGVSDRTVESLLANNGYIAPRQHYSWFPYQVAA